jgi:hypothetical protein
MNGESFEDALGTGFKNGLFGLAVGTVSGVANGMRDAYKAKESPWSGKDKGNNYENSVKEAQQKYPNKAGKIEEHHIDPKYLGGDPKGPTVPIDAAYHQVITNEFRANWGYGQPIPTNNQLQIIKSNVYTKFPLPPGFKY